MTFLLCEGIMRDYYVPFTVLFFVAIMCVCVCVQEKRKFKPIG